MNTRQLVIVLIVLAVLGGAALFLTKRDNAAWTSSASTSSGKVLDFPINDVTQLTIKSAAGAVNLNKKNDVWTVGERADYPADFQKVSGLMTKLWELHPVQDVKVGPSQLARLQLTQPGTDANGGTLIELKGASDKRFAALLLGKTQMRESEQAPGPAGGFPVGRYVMPQDNSNHVFLVSDTFSEAETKPDQWLSREFVKIENLKTIAVASAQLGVTWTITRENATAAWKLTDLKPGEDFDATKASGIAALFTSPTFVDVMAPDAPPAETGLDHPSTARFETFDNFVYEFRIGKLTGENYAVTVSVKADLPNERTPAPDEKPEDKARLDQEFQVKQKQLHEKLEKEQKLQNRPYLMAKGTIEQLLKDRSAFMKTPSPSPSPAPAISPAKPVATPAKASPSPSPKKRP
jgi:hypothetical protein